VSQTLARRHWPDTSPVGRHIVVGRDSLDIVGVCADVKQFGLDADVTADLYVPLRQMPASQAPLVAARMYWVVQTAKTPLAMADSARKAVRAVDKDVATSSTRTIEQIVQSSTGSLRFITDLLRIAGIAGLLLAIIGVYAVTAFSVGHRTREIGIRLTLGATPSQVMRPLLRMELRWILIGLAIGAGGALDVSRALSSVLFAAAGVDVLVVAAVSAALGATALAACCVPAWRALGVDPAVALREG
jgi:putative ABC transport system permease protein